MVQLASVALCELAEPDIRSLAEVLDPGEQARSAGLHFQADRRAFIAAHGLLRRLLAEITGHPAGTWRFAREQFGRPRILSPTDRAGLRFSLSHTRGRVGVAIAPSAAEMEIGIDLEGLDRGLDGLALAESFFAPTEVEHLRDIPDPGRRHERFIALWTLKEAVVKATGRGLSQPLSSFSIRFDPIRLHTRNPELEDGYWHFRQWRPDPNQLLALAVRWDRRDPPEIQQWRFSGGVLLPDPTDTY